MIVLNEKRIALIFLSFLLVLSAVEAKSVILVVKNATGLSEFYESKVLSLLDSMGYDVTIIDSNVRLTYSDYDVIVVAGRPSNAGTLNQLDDSIAGLPVNNMPSVVIDSKFLDDWGWTKSAADGTTTSGGRQKIVIQNNSIKILENYSLKDKPYVHIAKEGPVINIRSAETKMNVIASTDEAGNYGVIAVAEAGQELHGATPEARVVFFGITYSIYWTEQAEIMFKESVKWVSSDVDADGILDYNDNCPSAANADQSNADKDAFGDACDKCPSENSENYDINKDGCIDDSDSDGIKDNTDNCPFIANPDQSDKNSNGKGDKCDILPGESVEEDVDNDGVNETATNKNGLIPDGYELYNDPNSNTKVFIMDGDNDGMTDYLIDVKRNGVYDKYWDPDNALLTEVAQGDADNDGDMESLIDVNSDNIYEKIFDKKIFNASDLAVRSVSFSPESPAIGGDVAYDVLIENKGGYNATNFTVSFYHNDLLALNKTISLLPNQAMTLSFNATNLASGNHRLKMALDSMNEIVESNEQNNNVTTDVFVSFPVSSGGGGGGGGGSRFVPAGNATLKGIPEKVEIDAGSSVKISGSFVNNFNYDLRDVKLFLRGEGLDTRWFSLEPDLFDEVKKGETKNFELTFSIPEDSKIYTYSLILRAAGASNYGTVTIPHEFKMQIKGNEKATIPERTRVEEKPEANVTDSNETVVEKPSGPLQPTGRLVEIATSPLAISLAVAAIASVLLVWKFYPRQIFGKKGYVWGRGWKN